MNSINSIENFKQIRKTPVTEMVSQQIREMISSGRFKPGDKLPSQKELEKLMNVSRPTLREALSMLTVSGIIEARQGQGYFVRKTELSINISRPLTLDGYNEKDFRNLFEARLLLESSITQMAAMFATDEECEQLIQYVEKIENHIIQGDEGSKFHQMVADFSHNTFLAEFEKSLLQFFNTEEYGSIYLSLNDTQAQKIYELEPHRKIAEAIRSRDPQRAYYESFTHIMRYISDLGIKTKYKPLIDLSQVSPK